nr:response regulator transcription factor [Lientehia hominis]
MIIDDDVYIGDMLEETLAKEGYGVLRAYSGTEAFLILKSCLPDLVLLDLMLPGLKGEEVLARISGIPVIVVSARADVGDKVQLLLGGAVDYITKPFYMEELLARIAVQLRGGLGIGKAPLLACGDLVMDTSSHSVRAGEIPVRLTKTEYAILRQLMQNSSQVVTKSQILELISQDTPDCMESSLKVHVSNLRRKLREASGKDYIEAVWGIGFKLREE